MTQTITASTPELPEVPPSPQASNWVDVIGLALAFSAAAAMFFWTWAKWCDVLVDFGRELYVPWQLALGKVLYRDIAYFNGPLSPYLNSLWFRFFGPSFHALATWNVLILGAIIWLLYEVLRTISSSVAAIAAILSFVGIFAFGQYEFVGNYNYIGPYSHELTHGMALSLAALYFLRLYLRSRRPAHLFAVGVAAGLVFLTKPEIFIALACAITAAMAVMLWRPDTESSRWRSVALVIAGAITPPLITFVLLTMAMPAAEAEKYFARRGWVCSP